MKKFFAKIEVWQAVLVGLFLLFCGAQFLMEHVICRGEFKDEAERRQFIHMIDAARKTQEGDFITVGGKWYMVSKRTWKTLTLEAVPQSKMETKVLHVGYDKTAQDGGLTAEDRVMRKDNSLWEINATYHFLQ